jgi:hypothetical protein
MTNSASQTGCAMNHHNVDKTGTALTWPTRLKRKKAPQSGAFQAFGAGNQVRTGDLNLGKVALYQLSYSREGARF